MGCWQHWNGPWMPLDAGRSCFWICRSGWLHCVQAFGQEATKPILDSWMLFYGTHPWLTDAALDAASGWDQLRGSPSALFHRNEGVRDPVLDVCARSR